MTASNDNTSKEFKIKYDELLEVAQQYELRPLTTEECQSLLKRTDCSLHLFNQDQTASNLPVTPTPEAQAASTPTLPAAQASPTVATATIESQALPATESFYAEEFDGNIDDWTSFMTSGLEKQVNMNLADGNLSVQLAPFEDKIPWVYLVNDAFTYSDVQVEVVATNNGNNANGVSLVCQYSENGWYEFSVSNAGLYSIYAYDATAPEQERYDELINGGSPAIKFGHVTNTYTAVCKGNELTLLANDIPIKSITDTSYNFREGMVGIAVSSPQLLPVDVQIESVTVSEP